MGVFALIFLGDGIFENVLKAPVPGVIRGLTENKLGSFMFTWLIGNMVSSGFTQTGAFEIYHHKRLVWSSVKAGRMPTYPDLINGFKKNGVEFMESISGGHGP